MTERAHTHTHTHTQLYYSLTKRQSPNSGRDVLVSQLFLENRSSCYLSYKTQVNRTTEKPQMRWE